jgi:[ribosomal protein S5]-alanine N-acetyltransferase
MEILRTQNLLLIPLSASQLKSGLRSVRTLATDLRFPLANSLFDGISELTIGMRIDKMLTTPVTEHSWYTYWLIYVKEDDFGVGVVGFKAPPDSEGVVEIEFTIDELFWGRGLMTETVKTLTAWAFQHAECQTIKAQGVALSNLAAQKVLQNNGFIRGISDQERIEYQLSRNYTS